MKLTLVVIAILNVVHVLPTAAIEVGLRVLLNQGTPLGVECNADEWMQVSDTTSAVVNSRRRNLRQLQTYPTWCAEKCRGFAKGTCIGVHYLCKGYRRLENGEPMSAPATSPEMDFVSAPAPAPIKSSVLLQPRNLEISSCADGISKLNTALDKLAQQVSPSCNSLLMAPRDVTCLTNIDKCNIHKMSLVNADSGAQLVENFTNGMSFCSNGPKITFQAITDGCVCDVMFTLKNSAGDVIHNRLEFDHPFVLYSHSAASGRGKVNLHGKRLAVGAYTLEYYPDDKSSMTSVIKFDVKQC